MPATPLPLTADNPACTDPGVLVMNYLLTIDSEYGRYADRIEGLWIR